MPPRKSTRQASKKADEKRASSDALTKGEKEARDKRIQAEAVKAAKDAAASASREAVRSRTTPVKQQIKSESGDDADSGGEDTDDTPIRAKKNKNPPVKKAQLDAEIAGAAAVIAAEKSQKAAGDTAAAAQDAKKTASEATKAAAVSQTAADSAAATATATQGTSAAPIAAKAAADAQRAADVSAVVAADAKEAAVATRAAASDAANASAATTAAAALTPASAAPAAAAEAPFRDDAALAASLGVDLASEGAPGAGASMIQPDLPVVPTFMDAPVVPAIQPDRPAAWADPAFLPPVVEAKGTPLPDPPVAASAADAKSGPGLAAALLPDAAAVPPAAAPAAAGAADGAVAAGGAGGGPDASLPTRGWRGARQVMVEAGVHHLNEYKIIRSRLEGVKAVSVGDFYCPYLAFLTDAAREILQTAVREKLADDKKLSASITSKVHPLVPGASPEDKKALVDNWIWLTSPLDVFLIDQIGKVYTTLEADNGSSALCGAARTLMSTHNLAPTAAKVERERLIALGVLVDTTIMQSVGRKLYPLLLSSCTARELFFAAFVRMAEADDAEWVKYAKHAGIQEGISVAEPVTFGMNTLTDRDDVSFQKSDAATLDSVSASFMKLQLSDE